MKYMLCTSFSGLQGDDTRKNHANHGLTYVQCFQCSWLVVLQLLSISKIFLFRPEFSFTSHTYVPKWLSFLESSTPIFFYLFFIIYIYFVQFVCNSFLFCFNLHSNTNLWFIKLYTLFTKLITKGKIQVIYRVILNYVTPSNNFLLDWYFKNSIVGLYVYYVLSTHIKFRAN